MFASTLVVLSLGKFAKALPIFESIAEADLPSRYYSQQSCYYIEHPAEWDGFWKASSK